VFAAMGAMIFKREDLARHKRWGACSAGVSPAPWSLYNSYGTASRFPQMHIQEWMCHGGTGTLACAFLPHQKM